MPTLRFLLSGVASVALSVAVLVAADPHLGPGNKELHVVCVNTGSCVEMKGETEAAVHVDRPGKAVTLVLCAYNPVIWHVTAAPATTVATVVLGGFDRQAVRHLPGQPVVVKAFRQPGGNGPFLRSTERIDSVAFRHFVRAVHTLTGQEITSYRGTYQAARDKPFLIDRTQGDPRLRSDYPQPVAVAGLPAMTFHAVEVVRGRARRGQLLASHGDFTLAGPKALVLQPLPKDVLRLATDPATARGYGLTRANDVVAIDLNTNTVETITPRQHFPRLGRTRAIALDSKRRRVLVAAGERLFAFDLQTAGWEVVTGTKPWAKPVALAYHAATDALYGIDATTDGNGDSGVPVLRRFDAQGTEVSRVRLGEPMFPGVVGADSSDNHTQLISAGDFLVVVATRLLKSDRQERPETYLFLIDPNSGTSRLTWRYPEH